MSCNALELQDMCMDISAGPYLVEGWSEDTDFVDTAKAEVHINGTLLQTYTVDDGITISNYNGNPRYLEILVDNIPQAYAGRYMTIHIRPTADTTDVMIGKIRVVDNRAKQ